GLSSRIISENINPQQTRQLDIKESKQNQYRCDNRKNPQVKSLRKKRPRDKIHRDSFDYIEHVIHIHRPEKISGFFIEFGVAMAALVVHFWKTERKKTFL